MLTDQAVLGHLDCHGKPSAVFLDAAALALLWMNLTLAIACRGLSGPVNVVSPQAVTNRVYTRTLGNVLRRPTLLPLPAFAARLALGEMAQELLLASTRVEPRKLLTSGYQFRHPLLEGALRHVLGRQRPDALADEETE